MKILQINTTSNWGSHGRIAENIGLLVQNNKGENYIAYGRYSNPSLSETLKIGNKFDFYFHAIQTRIFDKHGLASQNATRKLITKIKEIRPNIIHLHNIHGYYLNYKILFKSLSELNIPVVWTLHDCWAYTGHCSHYAFIKCNRWKIECNNCPQKHKYPSSWIIDRSKRNYLDKKEAFTSLNNLTIVSVSNWLAEEIKESFLNKYPITVIYNGVDLKTFYPKSVKKKTLGYDDKFVILGVASKWDEKKGLNDFIHLRRLLPSNYIIVLIGLSLNQINKLPDGIIGIERTNNVQELSNFYSVADVYINFSVEETFGMTTCESMACGTPVIVYNSTACPEIVSNDTGYVVEIGDFDNVVKIIKEIETSNKKLFREKCRNRAIQLFNQENQFQEYIYLYKKILQE